MTLCQCGCGKEAKPGNRFVNGHNSRGDNNPAKKSGVGLKISNAKMGKKRPDMVGDNNPMNQPGVADKVSDKLKGRIRTDDHRKHLSDSINMAYVNKPELVGKIRKSVIKWRKDNPELVDKMLVLLSEWYENNSDKVRMYARKGGISSKVGQCGKSSSIEIKMRKILLDNNYEFEVNKSVLNLCIPDIIFRKEKVIIQCDGDYWHNYPEGTEKDRNQDKILTKNGWQIIRFWEHEIHEDIVGCFDRFEWFTFGKFNRLE